MDRRERGFGPYDEGLRRDVGDLGSLVGQMLREQRGDALFELVEAARAAAIRRREGDAAADGELRGLTKGLAAADAADLVRAFSSYFQVVNLAERVHRIRRRRDYQRSQSGPQPGGVEAALIALRDKGVTAEQAAALMVRIRFEPVFTAHPTEATRRTLLEKQQRIARALIRRLDPSLTPGEQASILGQIRAEVTAAWQTDEHPSDRLSVADELEHVLFYLTDVIYPMVPPFVEAVRETFLKVFGEELPASYLPLKFSSWVGGDMDGNPNVGGETFTAAVAEHERLIIGLYLRDVRDLGRRLSQSINRIPASDRLLARLGELSRDFEELERTTPPRHRDMPYRRLLRFIEAKLNARRQGARKAYESAGEFAADLDLIAESLRSHRGDHAGLFTVDRLRTRLATFGFHLVSLDMREDSGELREGGGRVLEAMGAVSAALRRDAHAAGTCVISMARDRDDVYAVLSLAEKAGLLDSGGNIPIDVAPLFETVDDLQAAPRVLSELLADVEYRKHLVARGGRQTIMLGYSDSNKDSGIAAARWALYRCQQELVRVAETEGIDLLLFHGRGGTTSRGGGKIGSAVRAAPRGSLGGHLRVTEQGEIINAKYGLRGIASRTFDQAIGAILSRIGDDAGQDQPEQRWLQAMECVGKVSRGAYRGLVFEDARLPRFFMQATPIDVIERMMIGSRPSRRASGSDVKGLRAIPWVFGWTQCRIILPGWFGLGAGLEKAEQEFGLETLKEMHAGWPFFRTLLDDAGMVMAKADLAIASHYADLADSDVRPVFDLITSEFERTYRAILGLTGGESLLADDPVLQQSIRLRNPYVDPMSLLQVDLLRRWRDGDRADEELLEALLATVNGISQGLQNTG